MPRLFRHQNIDVHGTEGARKTTPRFNTKTPSNQYRDSHYNDETAVKPSYIYNGNPYTGKRVSLYWNGAHVFVFDEEVFQPPISSQCSEMIQYRDTCL